LLFGAAISFYSGHTVDAIAIAVIVLINALISFVQEHNAQKSMDSLKQWLRLKRWCGVTANGILGTVYLLKYLGIH